jgi:hypothetical protein
MASPTTKLHQALETALRENTRQLGKVFALDPSLKKSRSAIVKAGGAANTGAVYNLQCAIRAILFGEIPQSPSVARLCLGTINGLIRDNAALLPEAKRHLTSVCQELEGRATSDSYVQKEADSRRAASEDLAKELEKRGGVYAYSLPHYLNYPCKKDPDRFWFKVGCTSGDAKSRVVSAHRETGLPEDPILRLTFFSEGISPKDMEGRFHKLLKASGLQTDALYGGKEWFATTEDQLIAMAEVLGFEVVRPRDLDSDGNE